MDILCETSPVTMQGTEHLLVECIYLFFSLEAVGPQEKKITPMENGIGEMVTQDM